MFRLQRKLIRAIAAGVLGWGFCGMHALPARAESGAANRLETVESRTITVRIGRPLDQVYEFLADPANWNQWAFGLGKNIRRSNDGWIADSAGGVVQVRFTARNSFGVVDHTVMRPSG
jgi:hypothetical protein